MTLADDIAEVAAFRPRSSILVSPGRFADLARYRERRPPP